MIFTLESLKAVEPSLIKLLKEDLPIRISYQLSKLHDIISKEMQQVEGLRQELVRRYGEENDGITRVTEENILHFNKDFGELMAAPVDAGIFEPIPINQILNYSERMETMGKQPISLSAVDIGQLKMVGLIIEGE